MIKKIPFIVFFIILNMSVESYAQRNETVAEYYKEVNAAEMNILDSQYAESLRHYQKADVYKSLNAEDLFNAHIVAYLSGAFEESKGYLFRIAAAGLKKSYFLSSAWGGYLFSKPFFKKIATQYDSLYRTAFDENRMKYYSEYKHFFEKDQTFRRNSRNSDSMIPLLDRSNWEGLSTFIKDNGFPSFERLGYVDTARLLMYPGSFGFMFWHTRSVPDSILDDIAYKAVMKGDMPPDDYAIVIDFRMSNMKRTEYSTAFDEYVVVDTNEINKRRAEIYLEPIDQYHKKAEYFTQTDKRFLLMGVNTLHLKELSKLSKRYKKG